MSPKAIVFFAFLAVVAGKPQVGIQMLPILPSFARPHLPLVVGGKDAQEGAYPFIVSLQGRGQHFCAGSIYNEEWIVTAGHCVKAIPSLDIIKVKAGKHNISASEASEQTVGVAQSFIHESYEGGVNPYDIGLLKLSSPLKFTNRVQPIELAPSESEPTGTAWLCGWGSTSGGPFPEVELPEILQDVELEYIDRATCHESVKHLTGSSHVHETNVCTGPDGKVACSGDSGGPLISYDGQKPLLTGIVSWGIVPCGSEGAPSVYTKVSKFNDWVAQKSLIYGDH